MYTALIEIIFLINITYITYIIGLLCNIILELSTIKKFVVITSSPSLSFTIYKSQTLKISTIRRKLARYDTADIKQSGDSRSFNETKLYSSRNVLIITVVIENGLHYASLP